MQEREPMLFLCDQQEKLIRDIRRGLTAASPFTGIVLLNVNGGRYDSLGINGEISPPFTFVEIDDHYAKLTRPPRDFIDIPHVYIGPERRGAVQLRPRDRRFADHVQEKRYRPICTSEGVQWQQMPNRAFLNALLPLHKEFRTGGKTTAIPKLNALLAQYAYPPELIRDVIGDQNLAEVLG